MKMEATLANTAPGETVRPRIPRILLTMARRVWSWQQRAHERAHLESLDAHLLRDVGLTRADVLRRGRMGR
jgi:uncharacterized protein YjiS (DUF1127 family)